MTGDTFTKFIHRVNVDLSRLAEEAMSYPAKEPFDHGMQVGKYQGLAEALAILNLIIEEQDEQ